MANQEGVDIIIKATDQYTSTINKIDASTKIFGKTVEGTQKQISALEKYMITLVANGLDPADKKIVQLKADYDKQLLKRLQTVLVTQLAEVQIILKNQTKTGQPYH